MDLLIANSLNLLIQTLNKSIYPLLFFFTSHYTINKCNYATKDHKYLTLWFFGDYNLWREFIKGWHWLSFREAVYFIEAKSLYY